MLWYHIYLFRTVGLWLCAESIPTVTGMDPTLAIRIYPNFSPLPHYRNHIIVISNSQFTLSVQYGLVAATAPGLSQQIIPSKN